MIFLISKTLKGQDELIESIVLGAAGGHNILMIGEPGCGKTMIAQRIPGILPQMTEKESLEVTKIHSISGLLNAGSGLMTQRPFRAPHHNVSLNALIGGGSYAIISGMAKGIDSYAHTAAIKAYGYTIAVLGNGVDICYPKEHQKLYEKIIENGCLLSEYPPGYEGSKYTFPKRNRIIAALSDELCVIDAGRKSGKESTIAAAIRYGRQVHLQYCHYL